jgi:hypothetical protein
MSGISFFQPNPGPDAPCPICGSPRPGSPRYPDHVCAECVGRARSEDGRPLRFFNLDLSGGIGAEYADTGEARASLECLVDGVRCRADEARFGGVVVRPVSGA